DGGVGPGKRSDHLPGIPVIAERRAQRGGDEVAIPRNAEFCPQRIRDMGLSVSGHRAEEDRRINHVVWLEGRLWFGTHWARRLAAFPWHTHLHTGCEGCRAASVWAKQLRGSRTPPGRGSIADLRLRQESRLLCLRKPAPEPAVIGRHRPSIPRSSAIDARVE